MKNVTHNFLLFFIGAAGYGLVELAYRGYTHWSMMITGGLCFFLLYRVFDELGDRCPIWFKGLFGALFITVMELYVGLIVNLRMGWEVWDYSRMPHQFLGQVCLFYTVAWFLLTIVVTLLRDGVRRLGRSKFDRQVNP